MAEVENLPLYRIKSGKQALSSARWFAIAANIDRLLKKKLITRSFIWPLYQPDMIKLNKKKPLPCE